MVPEGQDLYTEARKRRRDVPRADTKGANRGEVMDWDDLRFFLAVARAKSLGGAAKTLHVTQSTVGRRLAALESRLQVRLLHRVAEGFVPTLAGEAIMKHVERVEAEMQSVARVAGGLDVRLEGSVRVASTELLASHVLAPCIAALNTRHPQIRMELLASSAIPDLAAREADVCVQLGRFDQKGLVMRRIGVLAFGLYGSLTYLQRHGEPDAHDGYAGHHLITMFDENEASILTDWLATEAGRAQILLNTNSRETLFWASLHSGGLALLPKFRGEAEPALKRIDTSTPVPDAEIWLAAHEEVRHMPRVRAVIECVVSAFHRQTSISEDVQSTGFERLPQA